jgi:hypothetical protein
MEEHQLERLVEALKESKEVKQVGWERHLTTILVALVTVGIIYVASALDALKLAQANTNADVQLLAFKVETLTVTIGKSTHPVSIDALHLLENRIERLESYRRNDFKDEENF